LELIPELLLTVSPYTIGNVWITVIISYEVLLLLKKSKGTKRISQPGIFPHSNIYSRFLALLLGPPFLHIM